MKKLAMILFAGTILFSACEKEDAQPSNNSSTGTCSSVQCTATTQQNVRCTRMTTNCAGLCWQHD